MVIATRRFRSGFSLIELSIVLVIIGLIVGGVLVGRDLINAAAARAQISQIEKYQTAVNTFRGKYGYLPGDIPNPVAGQFGFQPRGLYAGEGDGNGVIEANPTGTYETSDGNFGFLGEEAMLWVDLSAVNLIDGSFTTAKPATVPTNAIYGTTINQYFPSAKIGNGGGYVFVWSGGSVGGDGNNYFAVSAVTGSPATVPGSVKSVALMTVAQAYAIDKKMDDGIPQSGNVMALAGTFSWASGGSLCPYGTFGPGICYFLSGDSDSITDGPVTQQGDLNDNTNDGPTSCYDGSKGLPEQYSISTYASYTNCSLSFKFQ